MGTEDKRLRPKYLVYKIQPDGTTIAGAGMKSTDPDDADSPFVLMPRKDPAAFYASIGYARVCEPKLANEIKDWLRKIAESSSAYGTQGERNRIYLIQRQIEMGL